jgi:hypothetical protein
MKFEYERFDIDYISRKVREENKRAGRLVTKVILDEREWVKFIDDMGLWRTSFASGRYPDPYRIAIYDPCRLSDAKPSDLIAPLAYQMVDVVCEGRTR